MMLNLDNLNIVLNNKKIVENVSFKLDDGEIFSLLGHNGSWKTSILKSIMWLYKCDWKIIFNGEQIQDLEIFERANKWIWYIMQEVPEYTWIWVLQYVKWVLQDKYDEEKVRKQFDLFGIDFDLYKNRNFDSQLSGGEKKKIEIIVSFLLDRQLYLLDEIETSLDATSRTILKNMILEKQTKWVSFIIVSHHEEIINLAENGILLCDGKIQNRGKTKELFEKYIWRCENCEIQNNCK